MFDQLNDKLNDVFGRLRKRGVLTEKDVETALREVRVALLEADVALPVAKEFIARVKQEAVGEKVLRSVSPAQQVVKIVHDALVEMLGGQPGAEDAPAAGAELNLAGNPPVAILMVGLQGSGKTTTTGKIGLRLASKERKKVLMASLDVARPAAQEQLAQIGRQTGVDTLDIVAGQKPLQIAERAMKTARTGGYDVVLLDTAGRLEIDTALMDEVAAVRKAANPHEVLLVADAMTGQAAVEVATAFDAKVGITGIVLTRVDGDARGGAALSMRAVTGKPVKLIGVGEKPEALEAFRPDRLAGRILGMGDVVSLVEKAAETIDREEADKLAEKMRAGSFDLEDYATQLRQMRKMGGLGGVMNLLPGMGKLKDQMGGAGLDDGMLTRNEAIIGSMTRAERRAPKLLNASRRRRIAAGSGTTVQDVNKLLKQYDQMRQMMKKMRKMGPKAMMRQLGPMAGLGGGGLSGGRR